jgi:hypothetical protein
MRRRELMLLLGGAAAWPRAGHAQQPERIRHVGVLIGFSENDPFAQRMVSAFAQALSGQGVKAVDALVVFRGA